MGTRTAWPRAIAILVLERAGGELGSCVAALIMEALEPVSSLVNTHLARWLLLSFFFLVW